MARTLHTTCQRYFAGIGCFRCPLCRVCDRQGYVPVDYNAPDSPNVSVVKVQPVRPEDLTSSDLEVSAEA